VRLDRSAAEVSGGARPTGAATDDRSAPRVMRIESAQLTVCVKLPGLGAVGELNSVHVTLEADFVARVLYVGDELVVPFESVAWMRKATSPKAEAPTAPPPTAGITRRAMPPKAAHECSPCTTALPSA
jgi:hypothetical protein